VSNTAIHLRESKVCFPANPEDCQRLDSKRLPCERRRSSHVGEDRKANVLSYTRTRTKEKKCDESERKKDEMSRKQKNKK